MSVLESLREAAERFGFPIMLKSRKEAYDDCGNFKVRGFYDFDGAINSMGKLQLYAEKWIPFEKELTIIVVRTEDDEENLQDVHAYPAVETIHEDSICTSVFYPPRQVSTDVCAKASKTVAEAIRTPKGRGIFAVKNFLLKDESITVNEVAPRPHNSGHIFIGGIPYMSQYKAHLYSVLGIFPHSIKLQPHVSAAAIMLNILGGIDGESHQALFNLTSQMYSTMTIMDISLHLYGKSPKPGRKIGHITVTSYDKAAQAPCASKSCYRKRLYMSIFWARYMCLKLFCLSSFRALQHGASILHQRLLPN
ncbi:hypothetical protein OIDMADRAFT_53872 [Oidiodendron maius Zn]|uniref:ATP-grasp domain-containing protein n=1 Tax=Oidiodendron maius (strain Zn) TaxID=913774 RepID=A0A0C3DK57_OIDMZ|nr:hypothetical protein OIDMADRAFT_53872 [Oidiodendron maius Zn]